MPDNLKAAVIKTDKYELVKNARFRYKASIDEVIYDAKRGIDRQKVLNLSTCDYIRQGVSMLITGASGTGKSCIVSSLNWHRQTYSSSTILV